MPGQPHRADQSKAPPATQEAQGAQAGRCQNQNQRRTNQGEPRVPCPKGLMLNNAQTKIKTKPKKAMPAQDRKQEGHQRKPHHASGTRDDS